MLVSTVGNDRFKQLIKVTKTIPCFHLGLYEYCLKVGYLNQYPVLTTDKECLAALTHVIIVIFYPCGIQHYQTIALEFLIVCLCVVISG